METIPVRHITTTEGEQPGTGRFNIRDLQQVLNGKDLVHALHKHDFFFVLLLDKGNGRHEIDFVPHEVHDHSIFILRPGQAHQLQLTAGSTGFLMEFDLAFYQPKQAIPYQRFKNALIKNYCDVGASAFVKLHSFLASIFHELTTKQDGYKEAIKANLDLFFIEYIRQSRNSNSSTNNQSSYTQERFDAFLQLLEENIGTMKNVSQYAAQLSLSPFQLNSITKASVGKTVSELITEQILLEAKRYLLATANQVKDIADHLGYEDVSYFIRFFKKQTSYSPDAFRKNFT